MAQVRSCLAPANPALPRMVSEHAGIPALRQGWSGHSTKNALARSLGASRRSPSSYHETPPASRACAEVCAAQLANKEDQKTGGGRHLCHQQEGAESPRAAPRLPWPCIPHLTARSAAGRRWAGRLDGVSVKMSSRDPIRRLLHTCSVLSAPGPGETRYEVCCSLPFRFRYTRSSQEDRRTLITKAMGRNRATTSALAEGDTHSDQTLVTDLLRGPKLLSLHLRAGGRPAFQGCGRSF